jgi:hypothetical protein
MTFINWSDSGEMLALLTEFVADERRESGNDEAREAFLADLLQELTLLNERFVKISTDAAIEELRTIQDSLSQEFSDDPVIVHLEACIEELERIRLNESSDHKSGRSQDAPSSK